MTEQPADPAATALQEAWNWIERRRYGMAQSSIARGLQASPGDPDLRHAAAWCEWQQDHLEAARAQAEGILAEHPQHFEARHLLALIARDQNRPAEAESLLLSLLQEQPANAGLIGEYASLMLRSGHLDKARKLAARSLQIDPENLRGLIAAALIDAVAERRPDQQEALATLLREHPEERATALVLINALVAEQRLEQAQALAESLVRADPRDSDVIDMVRELRYARHWSLRPLWPLQRYGWGGVMVLWLLMAVGMRALRGVVPAPILGAVALLYLAYCLYSWIWPSLLRRMMLGAKR